MMIEYLPGGDLKKYLVDHQRLSEAEVVKVG